MTSDSLRFTIQNAGWSALNPSKAKEVRKAMDAHRKLYPACAITGSFKKVQVHHIIPVWADPTLAADPDNFISLSSSAHIHIIYGHNNNFGKYYVKNIKDIAEKMREVKMQSEVVERVTIKKVPPKRSFFDIFLRGWGK